LHGDFSLVFDFVVLALVVLALDFALTATS
jgi:hypothetical protein